MKNNEVYTPSEFYKSNEFKSFSAENYKSRYLGDAGREKNYYGEEVTTSGGGSSEKKVQSGKNKIDREELLKSSSGQGASGAAQAATHAAGTAATSLATVAAAAAMTAFALTPSAPNIDLRMDVADTYIVYEMQIDNMQEDTGYEIIIEADEELYRKSVMSEVVIDTVSGLEPQTEYSFSVIGNKDGDVTTHYEERFTTTPIAPKRAEVAFSFTSGVDDGGFAKLDYGITVSNANEGALKYLIRAYCGEREFYQAELGGDDGFSISETLTRLPQGELEFQVYEVVEDEEMLVGSQTYDFVYGDNVLGHPAPTVTLGKIELAANNEYQVSYEIASQNAEYEEYSSLNLNIVLNDGTTQRITVENPDAKGAVRGIYVSGDTASVSVEATLDYYEIYNEIERSVSAEAAVTQEIAEHIELKDITVAMYAYDSSYGNVILSYIWQAKEGTYLEVSDGEEIVTSYDGSTVYFPYNVGEDTSLTYALKDSSGQAVIQEGEISIPATEASEYSFAYANPGSIVQTFNANGTVNLYINVDFSCDDSQVYYEIELSCAGEQIVYRSTDNVAVIENLYYEKGYGYSVVYGVYKEVGDVRYRIYSVAPSGSTDNSYLADSAMRAELVEGEASGERYIRVTLDDYLVYDFGRITVDIDGERIKLTEANFVHLESEYVYEALIKIDSIPENVILDVYARGSNNFEELAQKVNLKGDWYEHFRSENVFG